MLEFISKKNFSNEDLFMLIQATSPLIQPEDIDGSLNQFKTSKCDSLLSCVRSKRFFWNELNKPINYDYNNRPRRQDFNGLYMENGALYISSIAQIKIAENRLSGKISIFEMDQNTAIELDEFTDWLAAERLMQERNLKNSPQNEIKLFLSDVDGTLTDAGMYYGADGKEYKKFNTRDGKGFELLRNACIKTGFITSEKSKIVENRAKKLQIDYLRQGIENKGKLDVVKKICFEENITLKNVAYIGDDINCKELLANVGFAACPYDAAAEIKSLPGILILTKSGGFGVVREFVDHILQK
jgi:N-acylneuraminate cytidylyltransferase